MPAFGRLTGLVATLVWFGALLWASDGNTQPPVPTRVLFSELSLAGLTDKSTGIYTDIQQMLSQALQVNRRDFVDLNQELRSAAEIREEFLAFCADGDFADRVSWTKKGAESVELQFSCVKDGDYPRLRERLYTASLNLSPYSQNWELVNLKMLAADLAPESKFQLKPGPSGGNAITRATIAISGAMLLSAAAAKGQYPGQRDKVLHAAGTGLVAAGSAAYFHFVEEMSPERAALAGGALSILLGAAKEAADPYSGGVRSRHDMKANLLGGALGSVTVYLSFKFL